MDQLSNSPGAQSSVSNNQLTLPLDRQLKGTKGFFLGGEGRFLFFFLSSFRPGQGLTPVRWPAGFGWLGGHNPQLLVPNGCDLVLVGESAGVG